MQNCWLWLELFWAGRQCCMCCSGHLCWAALAAFYLYVTKKDHEDTYPIWTKYGSSGCSLSSIPLGLETVLRPKSLTFVGFSNRRRRLDEEKV